MGLKDQKYFCQKCGSPKSAQLEKYDDPNSTVQLEREVIKSFKNKETGEVFSGRKLECNHFVSTSVFAFTDFGSETLSDLETAIIRKAIEKGMLNKTQAELEQIILFHCEQYNTLLKISSKQKQQAKYAIQYLDQLREKFSAQLSNEEQKKSFEMRFAHFLDLKPSTARSIERERSTVDKEADKSKLALEKVRKLLAGSGIKTRFDKGFKKDNPPNDLGTAGVQQPLNPNEPKSGPESSSVKPE